MSEKLNEIYRSILSFAGMEADSQGFITTGMEGKRSPAIINGAQLVLPMSAHLRNSDPKVRMIYHPLTENILRGESEIIAKMKSVINVRLNYTLATVAVNLINLVASPEFHSRLSPEQQELLTSVSDADEKSQANFVSIMVKGIKTSPERVFTNVYLKRGGTFKGKRYSRVGIVSFPFYEQLIKNEVEGVRVKDIKTFKQVFEFMFPGINDPEEYNFGSESHVAPYLEALMRSAANVASRLNDLLTMYSEFIDEADKIMFDSEWMEYFQDLNALLPEIRKVPVQAGNDGTIGQQEEQVAQPAPQAAAAPVVPAQAPNPGYTVVSTPNGYMTVPTTPAPVHVPQQVAAPQPARKANGTVSFDTVMQSNPNVAFTPNALHNQLSRGQTPYGVPQQGPSVPLWAQQPQQAQPMMMNGMPQQQFNLQQFPIVQLPNGYFHQLPDGSLVPAQMQMPGYNPYPGYR